MLVVPKHLVTRINIMTRNIVSKRLCRIKITHCQYSKDMTDLHYRLDVFCLFEAKDTQLISSNIGTVTPDSQSLAWTWQKYITAKIVCADLTINIAHSRMSSSHANAGI
jgi:hypothetical protein